MFSTTATLVRLKVGSLGFRRDALALEQLDRIRLVGSSAFQGALLYREPFRGVEPGPVSIEPRFQPIGPLLLWAVDESREPPEAARLKQRKRVAGAGMTFFVVVGQARPR